MTFPRHLGFVGVGVGEGGAKQANVWGVANYEPLLVICISLHILIIIIIISVCVMITPQSLGDPKRNWWFSPYTSSRK